MNNESSFFENNLIKFLIKIISTTSIIFLTYYIFYENLYKRRNLSNEVIVQNTITTDTVINKADTAAVSATNQINYNTKDPSFYTSSNLISIENLNLSSDSLLILRQSIINDIPIPTSLAIDYIGLLNKSQIDSLEFLLNYYDQEYGLQIAVVTVLPFMYENLEIFSTNLFNKWGIGNKKTHYGIMFLIDIGGAKIRIENGRGVEKIYTNNETLAIIEKMIRPRFRETKYFEGIFYAANQMAGEITAKPNFIKIQAK